MNNQNSTHEVELDNTMDINYTKPTKSRFLFFLFFFGFFIFSWAGCYNLAEHKYQSGKDVPAPDNTLYDPKYK